MSTRIKSIATVERLSHQWHDGHRELDAFFDDYRKWSYEVSQFGFPHFGEMADRLEQLRELLRDHFSKENEICSQLIAVSDRATPEIEANRRRVASDHTSLLARLDELISRLNELEPPFESWEDALNQVERFCDALEQHEEQEADCIDWLAPKKG